MVVVVYGFRRNALELPYGQNGLSALLPILHVPSATLGPPVVPEEMLSV